MFAKLLLRAGCNGEIDAIQLRHLRKMLGRTLMQMELHVRILFAELPDYRRQDISRLRVGRTDGKRTLTFVLELVGHASDVLSLAQQPQRIHDHALPCRRYFGERPAIAHEDIHAQLFLQQFELLADGGLRRMQLCSGRGEVQIVLSYRSQEAQLLKFHEGIASEPGLVTMGKAPPGANAKS